MTSDKDAGAFIGHEPELAAERIPGGIRPQDERVAATQSEPAAAGEPAGDSSNVIESAGIETKREPTETDSDR
jgi:hypothetical protein